MPGNEISPFNKVLRDNNKQLKELSDNGRKIIGYFCTYTPIEVLHAAGFIPVRITGGRGALDKAYLHIPDFICPFMKRSLEKALDGQYNFLSGLVQGYTCDAACGMVNVWKDTVDIDFFYSIPIPYNNTAKSRNYFKSVLLDLIKKLETIGGSFSESQLTDSLTLYKRIRKYQLDLYKLRYQRKLSLSAADLMTVIDAGALTPPETYLQMLEELILQIPEQVKKINTGCPVLVSGSLIERPEIMSMIESSGGYIVADDLCNGFRQVLPEDGKGESSIDRLIHQYLSRFPCPSRSRASDRAKRILDLMSQSQARGVIFLLQKFCTPHLSDFPALSKILKEKGFPSILVEMDETWQIDGQPQTRIQGFLEMIKQ